MCDKPALFLQNEAPGPIAGADEKGKLPRQTRNSIELAVEELGDPRIVCTELGLEAISSVSSIRFHLPHFGVELRALELSRSFNELAIGS